MSYSLSLTNGQTVPGIGIVGLQDGTVNAASTSLSLVGKNYPGYGKLLNENFLHLLENFANSSSPSSALPGQLWWDSTAKVLKVNTAATAGDNARWKPLASIYNAPPITDATVGTIGSPTNIPYSPNVGDLWWDTANRQLKLYSAVQSAGYGGWVTIGPVATAKTGQTGATPDTVLDTGGLPHVVIKFYVKNELIGILSSDAEFTTALQDFPTIYPGYNLSSSPTAPQYQYNGIATTALSLRTLDGSIVGADNFVRTDAETINTVGLTTSSTNGVIVGPVGDVVMDINPVNGDGRIYHTVSGKNIVLSVTNAGILTPVLVANGAAGTIEVTSSPTTVNGIATKSYVDANTIFRDGSHSLTGNLVPQSNATINLGSTTSWFNKVYGVSMQAKFADLAERFAADQEYPVGTVVEIGGTAEITAVKDELSENVFGVISTNAAYLMNADSGTDATHPAVALSGRVPVRAIGRINKGDRLVSAGNGVARAAASGEETAWNVIGRSLEKKRRTVRGQLRLSSGSTSNKYAYIHHMVCD